MSNEIAKCPNPECGMDCEIKSHPGPFYRVQCTEKYCYIGPAGNTRVAAIRKHNGICRTGKSSPDAERQERENDPTLIELAKNYKPSPETLREISKYQPFVPTFEKMFMVLP